VTSYTEEMIEMIDSELKPVIAERDHYFDRCAKLEAAITAISKAHSVYCESGGGTAPKVVFLFRELKDAQEVHRIALPLVFAEFTSETGGDPWLLCSTCGKPLDDHAGIGLPCPTSDRAGK
jgi:hypothetical protein